ncbi:MAG: hypothetical protein HYU41_25745 [Candidatus Rokubacteria bacterium]|nr:hypothetical protein [Candidatus Rokubacteria bacterium]
MSIAEPVTIYQVWQHIVTSERWLVRIELDALTGLYGPLAPGQSAPDPDTIQFEDHPDDLEWVVRSTDRFRLSR